MIVQTMPPSPKTPQALYRLLFVYIIISFTVGWFAPINTAVWTILLVLSVGLFLFIRALSRGETGFRKYKDSRSLGVFTYILIPIMGILHSLLFGYSGIPYEKLSVAEGIIPALPYNQRRECFKIEEKAGLPWWKRSSCRSTDAHDYLPFQSIPFQSISGEKILLNCSVSFEKNACDTAYSFSGKKAVVKYYGKQIYELKTDDTIIFEYASQKAKFAYERKLLWLDALWAIPLYSLPLMWFHRQFKSWENRLAIGETVSDTPPNWWVWLVRFIYFLIILYAFYLIFI